MKVTISRLKDDPPYHLLLDADPSKSLVDSYLERGHCYVCTLDDKMVGVYVLLPTRPKTIEIVNIAVDPSYQGKGIGKLLVHDAIEKGSELGFTTIEIGTGNSSLSQLGLYQKCGFRIIGIDRDYFIRHYEDEIFENGIQCTDMVRLARYL
ncbi:GNAT family N-acetyltransferase [Cytobacillus sp. FJAT-54145]|uniref:GNAT family N-acetyltransferase n=1 Tax=Cytobacillus spartinae TaxID=3299023 RepID=A0ABW6K5R8_9BACI